MKRILITLLLVAACIAALGFYRGWFEVSSDIHIGKPNVKVRVAIVPVAGGSPVWIDWDSKKYEYLAQVRWDDMKEKYRNEASQRYWYLLAAYKSLPIGNPLDEKTVMGPLIDKGAVDLVQDSIQRLKDEGGEVLYGGDRLTVPGGCYMKPCLATAKAGFEIVKHETFGPLLYLLTYRDFDEAIAIQNDVPQGLTSSIFTNDVREAEKFVSSVGSDCGIANVNTGTSGAEIGGAFGGEKNTGGGRESGSDCWKSYMRRQTNTINFSGELPLAQGIEFGAGEGSATA
jgi:hypothetical protein